MWKTGSRRNNPRDRKATNKGGGETSSEKTPRVRGDSEKKTNRRGFHRGVEAYRGEGWKGNTIAYRVGEKPRRGGYEQGGK